jgi:hypothetical protein
VRRFDCAPRLEYVGTFPKNVRARAALVPKALGRIGGIAGAVGRQIRSTQPAIFIRHLCGRPGIPLEFICVARHIDGTGQFEGRRKSAMDDNGEPPSTARAKSLFRVGRNSRGNWVVQDQSGLCGGMFVNRTEAVKFAMFENGNRPQAVIMVPGILELDMSAQPREQNRSTAGLHAPLARAA